MTSVFIRKGRDLREAGTQKEGRCDCTGKKNQSRETDPEIVGKIFLNIYYKHAKE